MRSNGDAHKHKRDRCQKKEKGEKKDKIKRDKRKIKKTGDEQTTIVRLLVTR